MTTSHPSSRTTTTATVAFGRSIRLTFVAAILAFLSACSTQPAAPGGPRINPALRDELLLMEARDREVRAEAASGHPEDAAHMARLREVDAANVTRLRQIVDIYGWPVRDLVGSEAARAACTLALRADADPDFQARCLALAEEAHARGQVPGPAFAYLSDRVRMNRGQPQRYGTQFTAEDGALALWPVERPETLDERRRSVGLPPMAEYEERLRNALAALRQSNP